MIHLQLQCDGRETGLATTNGGTRWVGEREDGRLWKRRVTMMRSNLFSNPALPIRLNLGATVATSLAFDDCPLL